MAHTEPINLKKKANPLKKNAHMVTIEQSYSLKRCCFNLTSLYRNLGTNPSDKIV